MVVYAMLENKNAATANNNIYGLSQKWVADTIHVICNQNQIATRPKSNQIPYDYTVEVRNRFNGLDLIDRVPDKLWTEIRDTVQETGIKTILMEKKCKKAKQLSGNMYTYG